MYETVLNHNGTWEMAKTTYLVCKINGEHPMIITNDRKGAGNKHAEELLIDKLIGNRKVMETNDYSVFMQNLTDTFSMCSMDETKTASPEELLITVYINNSPCSDSGHECTKKLITFLDNNIRVRMKLFVTNLYNIRRESCKNEKHYNAVKDPVHESNYKGLRSIMQHKRCEIKAFTKDIWKELLEIVTVPNEVTEKLLVKYEKKTDQNDRSREVEDKHIQNDLNHIRDNPY